MKKDYTHLVNILDRSGSVDKVIADMRGGYNTYIREQQKLAGQCTVTTTIFDNEIKILDDFVDIKDFTELTESNYYASGTTALLDAIGLTLNKVGEKLNALPEDEKPELVVVYINTDGMENASKDFNRAKIAEMIKLQQDVYKWKFLFLGANIDAFSEGAALNIRNNANYVQTAAGIRGMSNNLVYSVSVARGANLTKSAEVEDYFASTSK